MSIFLYIVLLLSVAKADSLRSACLHFYDPSANEQLIESENVSSIVRYRGWFDVAVPHIYGDALEFEYQRAINWDEVERAMANVDNEVRTLVSNRLRSYKASFKKITRHFHEIKEYHRAKMEARLKDFESVRDKIIEKAKEASKFKRTFEFDRIDDFIGIRLIADVRSELLMPLKPGVDMRQSEMREYFKTIFRLPDLASIPKVEIRGTDKDILNQKYYRAIHITLLMDGTPVELQVMSQAIAVWHHWDHPKVYKSQTQDERYEESLKNYSRFWVRFIRELEDNGVSVDIPDQIERFLPSDRRVDFSLFSAGQDNPNWLVDLDRAVSATFQIHEEDRFLSFRGQKRSKERALFLRLFSKP